MTLKIGFKILYKRIHSRHLILVQEFQEKTLSKTGRGTLRYSMKVETESKSRNFQTTFDNYNAPLRFLRTELKLIQLKIHLLRCDILDLKLN